MASPNPEEKEKFPGLSLEDPGLGLPAQLTKGAEDAVNDLSGEPSGSQQSEGLWGPGQGLGWHRL